MSSEQTGMGDQDRSSERRGRRSRTRDSYGRPSGGGNAVYGLGLIGAAVYYIQHADGFWAGVVGLLKALVWPAFLIYYAFKGLLG